MENLYNLYENTITGREWDYYKIINYLRIKSISDMKSAPNCKKIIKQMIKVSGKIATPLSDYIDKLDKKRLQHIVSCFFLGHVFYDKFCFIREGIDNLLDRIDLKNDLYNTPKKKFSYIWFLCSLFHDLGYAIEEGEDKSDVSPKLPLITNIEGIPEIYSEDNINKYKCYRKRCHNKKDHGIYGGSIFYSEMCKLRKEKQKPSDSKYWSPELEIAYAYAAWVIICHNIFFKNEDDTDVEQYKKCGLDDFILSKGERKIKFDKHPLLFFFCLIDSIEPLKQCNYDIEELKNISISCDSKGFIKLEANNSSYIGKTTALNDWLTDVNSSMKIRI